MTTGRAMRPHKYLIGAKTQHWKIKAQRLMQAAVSWAGKWEQGVPCFQRSGSSRQQKRLIGDLTAKSP